MSHIRTPEDVFEIVKRQIKEVLFDLPEEQIAMNKSLRDLGANSLDRSEIAMNSMEALGLSFPSRELAGVQNIGDLVNHLYQKLRQPGA